SGGMLNLGAGLELLSPCTNYGTMNLSNGSLIVVNNGHSSSAVGGVVNAAGAAIDFWGASGIQGSGGQDYLINQGTLTKEPGSASTVSIQMDGFDNQGTLSAQHGTLSLN